MILTQNYLYAGYAVFWLLPTLALFFLIRRLTKVENMLEENEELRRKQRSIKSE